MKIPYSILPRRMAHAIILLCLAGGAVAQVPRTRTVFVGQGGYFMDYYWADDYQVGYNIYRRPTLLHRFVLDAQWGRSKWDVPIHLQLTAPFSRADRIPAGPANLRDYLLMPGNAMRIAPSFRKLKFLLGNHNPTLSALRGGNIAQALGIGMELTPGWFRLKASYGMTHRQVGYRSSTYPGQYERRMITAQIGLGDDAKTHFRFNFLRFWDRERPGIAPSATPAEGEILSADLRVKPRRSPFHADLEVAVAAYTNDRHNTSPPDCPPLARIPFATNGTTVGDAAIQAGVGMQSKGWNLALLAKYVGANYRTAAYLYQVAGYLDLTAQTDLHLFKQKLQFYGLGGFRTAYTPIDKVDGRLPVSDQALLRATGHLQLTRWMAWDGHFSNYAWQDPTLFGYGYVGQSTRSQGIGTTLRVGGKTKHAFTASATFDQYLDVYVGQPDAHIQARLLALQYQLRNRNQSGLTLGANQFESDGMWPMLLPGWGQLRWNAYAGIQKNFFHDHCQMRLQMQVSWTDLLFPVLPDLLAPSLAIDLKLAKKFRWTIEAAARQQLLTGAAVQLLFARNALQFQF